MDAIGAFITSLLVGVPLDWTFLKGLHVPGHGRHLHVFVYLNHETELRKRSVFIPEGFRFWLLSFSVFAFNIRLFLL